MESIKTTQKITNSLKTNKIVVTTECHTKYKA